MKNKILHYFSDRKSCFAHRFIDSKTNDDIIAYYSKSGNYLTNILIYRILPVDIKFREILEYEA